MKIIAAKTILKANDQLAAVNRKRFDAAKVYGINVVGSPGSGKTTLIEAIFRRLQGQMRLAVVEGDIAGSIDAQRMEALGVPVVQLNTDGACHLDATMVATAIDQLDLDAADVLLIENIGNLVCTAGFDLGEHLRIIVLSVTEGDDKAVKYPAIFQGSDALFVTKTDLLPYTNFSMERITADMRRLAPYARVFQVSALHNDGIEPALEWLVEQCGRSAVQVAVN